MLIFLNGNFVSHSEAAVSPLDRGFLYGDGLFETLRVYQGRPFAWNAHWDRMTAGARFLQIKMPGFKGRLQKAAAELIQKNQMPESILRIQLSRGLGVRGYSVKGADQPTLLVTLHPAPPLDPEKPLTTKLITSRLRLFADDPLARFKTCNKLSQIVTRTEAENKGAGDALFLNHREEVAETTSANIFWIQKNSVCTPPLSSGILPGVTRGLIQTICRKAKIPFKECCIPKETLRKAEGVFLTSSVFEILEVTELDRRKLRRSPLVGELLRAYRALPQE